MEIYRPLTKVKIDDDITGIITSVEIFSSRKVIYNIEWWNGKSLMSNSFDEIRITPEDYADKRKIGFK